MNKVIAIIGATASGKTAYSIELAKEKNGEIISADSRLVYKGFDIGTAKPTIQERCGIPHYMIDIVEPEYDYSVALYKDEATKIINDILSRGKTPIIVGGTGLYIDILLKNYTLPRIEPDKKLREQLYELSTDKLYEIFYDLDKEGAQTIEPNDRKKIIRSIEIIKNANLPLSKSRDFADEYLYEIEWIGRNFVREELYDRINKRVDIMIETGLVDETQYLLKKHGRIPNLVNTIGYREIIQYLDKKLTLEEAKAILKQNTRNYAKRQLTWFRKNENIKWNIFPEKLKK